MKFILDENVFLLIKENKIIAWNAISQKKYEISLEALKYLLGENVESKTEIITELISSKILINRADKLKHNWDWDELSKFFHYGTKVIKPLDFNVDLEKDSIDYVNYCNSIKYEIPKDAFEYEKKGQLISCIPSDETFEVNKDLVWLLNNRISSRRFTNEFIDFKKVKFILDEAFKYREHCQIAYKKMGMSTVTKRRSSPSGGSLQSCEGYLINRKVSSLEKGIYHFRSHSRQLCFTDKIDDSFNFGKLFGGQMFAEDLSAAIIISCRLDKLMWKYKQSRSYRVALMDAGHLSQTIQLLATSVGLNTWVSAAFFDDELSDLLSLDSDKVEIPLLVVGLGTGEINPFDKYLEDGFNDLS